MCIINTKTFNISGNFCPTSYLVSLQSWPQEVFIDSVMIMLDTSDNDKGTIMITTMVKIKVIMMIMTAMVKIKIMVMMTSFQLATAGRLVVEKPADSFTCLPYPARYFNLNFPSKLFLGKVFRLSPTKTFPDHIFWQSGCTDGQHGAAKGRGSQAFDWGRF